MASPAATDYVPDVEPELPSDSGSVRPSRRRSRWRKWFWLLAVVVAIRVGLAVVLVPFAQQSLSRVLGTRVEVGDVSFAPIDAVFTLRNVVVHAAGEDANFTDATPPITAGRVRIDVQWLPLLHRSLVLRELALESARIDVDRLRDAGWTLEHFQQLEPATELPQGWSFALERLALRDTHVRPGDVGTGDAEALDVTVRDARVSIGRRRASAFGRAPNLHVDAVVDGGRILIVGSTDPRDDGVLIDATIHVKDAPLERFGAYRPAVLGSSIAGEVSGRLHYQRDPGRRDRIVGRLRGRHIDVQVPALHEPALAIRRMEVGIDSIDLLQRRIAIGNVMLYGARLAIRPDLAAPVPLLDGLTLPSTDPVDRRRAAKRAAGTPSWIWTIGHLESPFARLLVAGRDPDTEWLPASLSGEHIGPGAYWSPVRAWIGWPAGTAVFDGTARMAHGFSLEGRVLANDVDAVAVARAAGPPLSTLVQAGRGTVDLEVQLGTPEPRERGRKSDGPTSPLGLQGKIAVADLWLAGPDPDAFAMGAGTVELDLARIVPAKDTGAVPEIGFSTATVTTPYVKVVRTPEGWSTGGTPDDPTAATTSTVTIAVDYLRTRGGRITMIDQTASPALALDLTGFEGSGRGFRLPAASLGEFDVQGTERRLGSLHLVGARSAGEIRAELTAPAVNLVAAAPYLQRAKLPYAFTAGTGTVQSRVYVVGDRWTADTTLTLVDPALGGDQTPLERSIGMTSEAAFAALRERQGQVSLQLPLASSPLTGGLALNETVAGALRDALARPRLAPSLQIEFAAGRTDPDAGATRQLAAIAETLAQNPDVVVELRGMSSRKDRRWFAEQTVAAEQPEGPGGFRGWFRSVVLRDQQTRIRDALAARGAGRPGRLDPEDESALGELVAAVPPIADDRLLTLATTRAALVAHMLADRQGVSAARVVIVDPVKEVTGDSVVNVRFLPRQEMAAW